MIWVFFSTVLIPIPNTYPPSHLGPVKDPDPQAISQKKSVFFIVTPHISKPHDYVNHMFMRP
jgi:hypothetical protein